MDWDDKVEQALKIFKLIQSEGVESRHLIVLSSILRMQKDPPLHFSFSDIYAAIEKDQPAGIFKKPAIHKSLHWLVETQLVRLESQTSLRRKYLADVNTLMAGLEKLKEQTTKGLQAQLTSIGSDLKVIETCDCAQLAKEMVRTVAGKKATPSSRFIRGMEEFERVTNSTIYDRAKKGDVIRNSLIWVGPFTKGSTARFGRVFEAAKKGIEVKYGAHPDILVKSELLREDIPPDWILQIIETLASMRASGALIDFRILDVDRKGYQFAALNSDVLAFFISEDPVTAAWVTREFNPDLIDNMITDFDERWERGLSVLSLTKEAMESMGAKPEGYLQSLLLKDAKDEKGKKKA